MKTIAIIYFSILSSFLGILGASCSQTPVVLSDEYKIVVDCEPFSEVSQAATAENTIDWSGTDSIKKKSCTESYAALELQQYLRRLSVHGSNNHTVQFDFVSLKKGIPPKAIILTDLATESRNKDIAGIIHHYKLRNKLLKDESFAIVPQKDHLFIIGHDRVGTLYGVYQLLEMLGVRWYAPGPMGEYVPDQESLIIPGHLVIQNPSFYTRGFWAWEPRGNHDFLVWMARNRLNLWTLAEPDHPFLNKLGIQLTDGGHIVWKNFLGSDNEYPHNHSLFHGDEQKPADPYKVSTEYRGDENHDGKLSYYETHPEWYGLVDGHRDKLTSEFGTNICTSNKDAVNEFCRNLVTSLTSGKWKDASIINLWPLDGGKWCQCNTCSLLGTPTDRLMVLINQIDKKIKEAKAMGLINRNIRILFPIYYETEVPPTKPIPADFDYSTCIGTFFPIFRCYVHYLDDSTCLEDNQPIWKDLTSWTRDPRRLYRGQICIGEYYNVSRTNNLPFIAKRIMQHDIPLYYRCGVRHFHYMHVCTGVLGMKRLNNYLMAKLLWDVNTNADSVYNNYLKVCYGSAAEPMGRLYSRLEYAMSNIKQLKHIRNSLSMQINTDADSLFPLQHFHLYPSHGNVNNGVSLEESILSLQDCREIMDSLLQRKWPAGIMFRLNEDDENLRYAENTYNLFYYTAQALQEKHAGHMAEAKAYYRETLPYAKGLKSENLITATSSRDANARDGMDATGIEKTYRKLGEELGFE